MAVPIDPKIAEEMRKADSGDGTTISLIHYSNEWKGHLLAKGDDMYTTWACDFRIHMVLRGLWEYASDPPPLPSKDFQPRAFRNWTMNDRLACAILATGVANSERLFLPKTGAKACWEAIKERHRDAGIAQQVRLLQEALSIKCSLEEPLTETIDRICDKIDRAYAIGPVSADTIKRVVIANLRSSQRRTVGHVQCRRRSSACGH